MPYTHRTTIRFADADALGHVNHARFLTYCEEARIAFLDDLAAGHGASDELMGRGLIVARVEVDYLRPLFPRREPVEVTVAVEHLGTRSFTLSYDVRQDGALASRVRTVVVAYDYAAASSRELTAAERRLLAAHVPS